MAGGGVNGGSAEPKRHDARGFDLTVSDVEAGCALIRLQGELDAYTVIQFHAALDRVLGAGAVRIAIDMSRLTFMDSSGLAELIATKARLEARSGVLALRELPDTARRLFEVTGVDAYLGVTS